MGVESMYLTESVVCKVGWDGGWIKVSRVGGVGDTSYNQLPVLNLISLILSFTVGPLCDFLFEVLAVSHAP